MSIDISELKKGQRIVLEGGLTAEVLAPSEDGEWIRVKYLTAPDDPELVGTEDLCSGDEIVEAGAS